MKEDISADPPPCVDETKRIILVVIDNVNTIKLRGWNAIIYSMFVTERVCKPTEFMQFYRSREMRKIQ